MNWRTGEFGSSHEGTVGVLLEDGTEPRAVMIDTGSHGRETKEFWAYDGKYGHPRAAYLRAACSCDWRAEARYPIDWDAIEDWPHDADTSAPYDDWARHIEDVEQRAVPLPDDFYDLLEVLEDRLGTLTRDSPLAGLRAVAAVEDVAKRAGWNAACEVNPGETPWSDIGRALGLSELDARTRMMNYAPDSVRNGVWMASGRL